LARGTADVEHFGKGPPISILYNVAFISEPQDDAYFERAFQEIFKKADLKQF